MLSSNLIGIFSLIKSILFNRINLVNELIEDDFIVNKSNKCLLICSIKFSFIDNLFTSITTIKISHELALEKQKTYINFL